VPALPGCFTQGETIEECLERAREAITGHLQSLVDLHQPIPEEPERDDAVIGKVQVNLPVSLSFSNVIKLPDQSVR
jgi:predicted RNase H-like HicB family nuclease